MTSNNMKPSLHFSINSVTREFNKIADNHFIKTGLSPSYALAMYIIIKSKSITQGDLSSQLRLAASTTTRFIDKLENKGLVARKLNGRSVTIVPTKEGEELLRDIIDAFEKVDAKYEKILGEELMHALIDNLAEADEKIKE